MVQELLVPPFVFSGESTDISGMRELIRAPNLARVAGRLAGLGASPGLPFIALARVPLRPSSGADRVSSGAADLLSPVASRTLAVIRATPAGRTRVSRVAKQTPVHRAQRSFAWAARNGPHSALVRGLEYPVCGLSWIPPKFLRETSRSPAGTDPSRSKATPSIARTGRLVAENRAGIRGEVRILRPLKTSSAGESSMEPWPVASVLRPQHGTVRRKPCMITDVAAAFWSHPKRIRPLSSRPLALFARTRPVGPRPRDGARSRAPFRPRHARPTIWSTASSQRASRRRCSRVLWRCRASASPARAGMRARPGDRSADSSIRSGAIALGHPSGDRRGLVVTLWASSSRGRRLGAPACAWRGKIGDVLERTSDRPCEVGNGKE